jgi:hypothetical protein
LLTSPPVFSSEVTDLLSALKEEVSGVLMRHSVSTLADAGYLSHFTKQENLIRILQSYSAAPRAKDSFLRLWLSDVSCLNDPLEGKALFQFVDDSSRSSGPKEWGRKKFSESDWADLRKMVDWIRGYSADLVATQQDAALASDLANRQKDGVSRRILVCSFTRDMDRLDLWRAYGEDGTGICLSMPLGQAVTRLRSYPDPVSGLFSVRYLNEEKATAWAMLVNHLKPIYANSQTMSSESEQALRAVVISECERIFHLYKHEQYRNEHEMRLIKTFDIEEPKSFAGSDEFAPGVRTSLELNRVYAYSDPFFLGSKDSKVIIGPRVREPARLATTLSTYLKELWGEDAPQVQLSTSPYR